MNTLSHRLATVALLSAVFAILAAGPSRAQNHVTNASNAAVRSAVTDARDAAFRQRDAALYRGLSHKQRHAALRVGR